jgi:hypothetical protein
MDSVDGGQQFRHGGVTGQGVAAVRLIHRQCHDVLVLVVVQKVWHVVILRGPLE